MSQPSKSNSKTASNVVSLARSKTIKTLSETGVSQTEVFRQKRIDNSTGQLRLNVGQESYRLINWSRTGLAFEVPSQSNPFPIGIKVGPTRIYVGEIQVYEGDIEICSIREASDGERVLGAIFKSRLFLIEGIEAAADVNRCVGSMLTHQSEMADIDPEVCKIIVDMGSALRILKSACDEQERRCARLTFDERAETMNIFLPSMSKQIKSVFDSYNQKLGKIINIEEIPQNTTYHRLFEEHIYPYFKSADLSRRAKEKPRGYDGDYEMMNQVYRQSYEGSDLMGKVIHHYSTNVETNESVQFRRPYFLSHMEYFLDRPGSKSFMSVASGPAFEVQDAVSRWPQQNVDRTRFVLFDLDREALEHAQTKILEIALEKNRNPNIDYVNASVRAFLRHQEDSTETFDLIYSGGLFDYLDNLTSAMIAQNLFRLLKPEGRLILGNFTKEVSTKSFISLILRWHLIYKSEAEMRSWANDIPNCKISVEYDPNKINAFLVLEKRKG